MRLRLAALLTMVVLAFGVRATSIYLRYLSTELSSELPFGTEVQGGHLVVKKVDPGADCYRGWSQPARPLPGDRVVGIYDHHGRGGPVHGLFDYGLYLRPINVEEPWTLVVQRAAAGGTQTLSLAMPPSVPIHWGAAQWLANLSADFYLPFLAVTTGLLIGLLRWRDDQAWLASLLFLALGLASVPSLSQFPPVWRVVALVLQVTAAQVLPYLVFRFFLRFPARSPVDRVAPWLKRLFAVETLAAWVAALAYALSAHVSLPRAAAIENALAGVGLSLRQVQAVIAVFAALMLFFALLSIVFNAWRAPRGDERRRLRIIAAGAVTGLVPAVLMLTATSEWAKAPVGLLVVAIPLVGIFPLSFAYAVVRHRVFGIRLILRRGLTYALVSRGFLFAEAAIIFVVLLGVGGALLARVQPRAGPAASTAATALATFMLTLGIRRVNRRILPVIDRRFFRDSYNGERILNDLSRAVRHMASQPDQLLAHVGREVMAALHPRSLAVFVRPDACSRATGLHSPARLCCALRVGEEDQQFTLCVEENGPQGGGASGARSAGQILAAPVPLGEHLAACAAGECEALEIWVFDGVAQPLRGEGSEAVPAARPTSAGDCLREPELLARFDARLVVPLVTAGHALGFLLLGEKRSEEPYSREDRELLLGVAGQAAIALDYAQLIGQAAEQAALRREVQIAQQVQRQLFPHERPPLRSLRYQGICRAARGVGGDFYDFLPLAADRLGLALADIAGKGLPAALLMANLQALIRSHAPTHAGALEELAGELNRHLLESSDGARFATLFFAVYDDGAGTLRYVNAGHLPPIVARRQSNGDMGVQRLDSAGMVLGLFPDQRYVQGCARLGAGDRLLVFSDGVTEAANPDGEMFGEERLIAAVRAHRDEDVEHLPEVLLAEVDRFVGPSPQQDDITVIAAEVMTN